jgi:hypothetical protein
VPVEPLICRDAEEGKSRGTRERWVKNKQVRSAGSARNPPLGPGDESGVTWGADTRRHHGGRVRIIFNGEATAHQRLIES